MKLSWLRLLIIAASLCLISKVDALKATSLIFGKVPASLTTTTTTTGATPPGSPSLAANTSADALPTLEEDEDNDEDSTKLPLTGNPQVDYVYDPNLPRELNGFNLSTYPFLSLVPDSEEIDFKCDGLHDGFYASIKFSCQVYHHCIYGIRHDFLCANYTAFDQKTFICQFVSVVDCKSSPKYWFRNDALYRATTTTSTTTKAPPTTQPPPPPPERPYKRRRPLRRRRPQIDYYYDDEEIDDYYDDELVNRRIRPQRTRGRRPEYDEYDRAYDDELPLNPRDRMRNDNTEYKRRNHDQGRNRNRNSERNQYYDDDRDDRDDRNDRRYYNNNNNGNGKRQKNDGYQDERRPLYNDDASDKRRYRNRRPISNPDNERPRMQQNARPINDQDYEDQAPAYKPRVEAPLETIKPKIRPAGGGSAIFKTPRIPPKISRPVPQNEKKKFEYIPSEKNYDDDDYEVSFVKFKQPLKKESVDQDDRSSIPPSGRGGSNTQNSKDSNIRMRDEYDEFDAEPEERPIKRIVVNRKPIGMRNRQPPPALDYDEPPKAPIRPRPNSQIRSSTSEQYYDDVVDTVRNQRDSPKNNRDRDRYKENPKRLDQDRYELSGSEKIVENEKYDNDGSKEICTTLRSVKRPFLPSRGGSPYLPRGLRPVGIAVNKTVEIPVSTTTESTKYVIPLSTEQTTTPTRMSTLHISQPQQDNEEYPEIESPKATLEKIYNSEYDATINDALNPTLKPLTLSSVSPIGFSLSKRFEKPVPPSYPYIADVSHAASSQSYSSFSHQPSDHIEQKSSPIQYYDDYEY